MPYLGEGDLQASLNAIYASLRSFVVNLDDEQLHLALTVLHGTQITLHIAMMVMDTEHQAKYESLIAIHTIFQETHRGIYNFLHNRNTLVIQPQITRDF